jgi:hypothetical protein
VNSPPAAGAVFQHHAKQECQVISPYMPRTFTVSTLIGPPTSATSPSLRKPDADAQRVVKRLPTGVVCSFSSIVASHLVELGRALHPNETRSTLLELFSQSGQGAGLMLSSRSFCMLVVRASDSAIRLPRPARVPLSSCRKALRACRLLADEFLPRPPTRKVLRLAFASSWRAASQLLFHRNAMCTTDAICIEHWLSRGKRLSNTDPRNTYAIL